MSKNYILFFIVGFLPFTLFSKKAPEANYSFKYQNHYHQMKLATVNYNHFVLKNFGETNQVDALTEFISTKYVNVKTINYRLQNSTNSLKAKHFQFQQYYQHYPIFRASIKLNINEAGIIYSQYNTLENFENRKFINQPIEFIAPILRAFDACYFDDDILIIKNEQVVVYVESATGSAQFAVQAEMINIDKDWHHEIILDEAGDLIYAKDVKMYAYAPGTVSTFDPDPLTTAQTNYGGSYIDLNNTDVSFLNNEIINQSVDVLFEDGEYRLKNDVCTIKNLESPVVPIPTTTDGNFIYTRANQNFESANAYFHLNTYKAYLGSIGFDNLVDYSVDVDCQAFNGADNSYFNPNTTPPRLLFGEGGVDDAEDADVIVHEYGHAIAHSAAPMSNNGLERMSIDEGFGDYIAASYSRSLNEFNWFKVFTWDGHNEFWDGRLAISTDHYPEDLNNSIHQNGEMWSSSLMQLWEILGEELTNKILFESLYNYAPNIPMSDAAYAYIQADSLLNNGENYLTIFETFYNRGFVEYSLEAGLDTTICLGNSVQLATNNFELSNVEIEWTPNENISDNNIYSPLVTPTESRYYIINLTDLTSNEQFVDSVFVEVEICDSQFDEIKIVNTQDFAAGLGQLIAQLPGENAADNFSFYLYNSLGQAFAIQPEFVGQTAILQTENIESGVYVVDVFDADENECNSFKVVRY